MSLGKDPSKVRAMPSTSKTSSSASMLFESLFVNEIDEEKLLSWSVRVSEFI